MPYKGDPIAEKLDKIAEATGMPRLSKRLERALPMRFRIIPLALLIFAIAGMGVQIAVSDLFGYILVMLAWTMSLPLQQLSPLRRSEHGSLDEREQALVQSGHFIGLIAALGVAVLGCIFIGMGSVANMAGLGSFWEPAGPTDWLSLALFLLAVESNVAVLAASAKLPEALEDEDE